MTQLIPRVRGFCENVLRSSCDINYDDVSLIDLIADSGQPVRVDPEQVHLFAPFEENCKMVENALDRSIFRRTSQDHDGTNWNDRRTAWVKTFSDVIDEYAYHPESKYADEHGNPSDRKHSGCCSAVTCGLPKLSRLAKNRTIWKRLMRVSFTQPTMSIACTRIKWRLIGSGSFGPYCGRSRCRC